MSSHRTTTSFQARRVPLALIAGAMSLALGMTGLPAYAQSSSQLGGQQVSVDVAARLQARIAELERLVQELTGRVEESQYETRRLNDRLDRMAADSEFRFNRLEQGAGVSVAPDGASGAGEGVAATAPAPTATMPVTSGRPVLTPPPAPGGPAANPSPASQPGVLGTMPQSAAGTPQSQAGSSIAPLQPMVNTAAMAPKDAYNHAFGLLRQSQFPEAEAAFNAFLKAHPDDELAGNAQYWLGETFYARGNYQQAAVAFLDGYRTYPKSAKAPDNLLKLGLAMGNLGKTAEACAALQRMSTEYPQAADFLKRRASAERDRLACR